MIQQVASSARQTLAAAKATSLQRCVRTQLRAGRHCLNPRAKEPRRRLPLIGATANDTSKIANKLPAPAAARTAADSGAPPPRKTSKATAHTSAKAQK